MRELAKPGVELARLHRAACIRAFPERLKRVEEENTTASLARTSRQTLCKVGGEALDQFGCWIVAPDELAELKDFFAPTGLGQQSLGCLGLACLLLEELADHVGRHPPESHQKVEGVLQAGMHPNQRRRIIPFGGENHREEQVKPRETQVEPGLKIEAESEQDLASRRPWRLHVLDVESSVRNRRCLMIELVREPLKQGGFADTTHAMKR